MRSIAFFSGLAGVGQTTLVYHLGHMFVDLGYRVLLMDLDPQAALTRMCLSEERVEELWSTSDHSIIRSLLPSLEGADEIPAPPIEQLADSLGLLPGDVALSLSEDLLSTAWFHAGEGNDVAQRALPVFDRIITDAAKQFDPDLVLADLGPFGSISRAALLASDFAVAPVAVDPYSLRALMVLRQWLPSAREASERQIRTTKPLGYVVTQAVTRLSRPIDTYHKWIAQIPRGYHSTVLCDELRPASPDDDPLCLGFMRHYLGLISLAQDARKPMFHLKPADGAIGAHMDSVLRCREDFEHIARSILERADALSSESS
jgi:cellulose biosynthesis protein BcsQ